MLAAAPLSRSLASLALVAAATTTAAAQPAPPAPTDAAAAPTTITRPWYSDTLGGGLVVGGTAGLIFGGVLYLSARTDIAKADQGAPAVTLAARNDLVDSADQKQLWAGIAAGVGGALLVGGIVRYVTGDRRETITVAPTGDGAGVALGLGGRF